MKDHQPTKPGPLFRALAVLGGGLVFVLIASVIHPGASTANEGNLIKSLPARTTPLGSLDGDTYTIDFVGTEGNALYTVRNAEGAIVLENATPEQIYLIKPSRLGRDEPLDIRRLTATIGDVDTPEF